MRMDSADWQLDRSSGLKHRAPLATDDYNLMLDRFKSQLYLNMYLELLGGSLAWLSLGFRLESSN